MHFGAGNIFRAFPAAILNDALNSGKYDRGVIVAESFDYEIIDKAYQPYDKPEPAGLPEVQPATSKMKVIASVTESLEGRLLLRRGLGTSGGDLPEPLVCR